MSKLNHFVFEVLPKTWAGIHGGEETVYSTRVEVDGKEYGQTQMAWQVPPNMSEIEYLTQRAVESLKAAIDKSDKTP